MTHLGNYIISQANSFPFPGAKAPSYKATPAEAGLQRAPFRERRVVTQEFIWPRHASPCLHEEGCGWHPKRAPIAPGDFSWIPACAGMTRPLVISHLPW